MVSEKKLAANRLNARKSTGPRTEQGKARSARNASTHGIFCRDLVLAGESEEEFVLLREQFIAALVPQDMMELALVDEIVEAKWKLKRVQRAERIAHEVTADHLEKVRDDEVEELKRLLEDRYRKEEVEKLTERQRAFASIARGDFDAGITLSMMCADPTDRTFERLTQYAQRLQNSVHRCMRDLKQLRKDREKDLRPSIYSMDREVIEENEPRRHEDTKEARREEKLEEKEEFLRDTFAPSRLRVSPECRDVSIMENEPTAMRESVKKHGRDAHATGQPTGDGGEKI